MNGHNFALITGRLGRDAEVKETQNGNKVVSMSLAVDDGFGDKKQTFWVKFEAWGKQAEFLGKYGTKGKAFTIVGRTAVREWIAPEDSKKHSSQVIVADHVEFAAGDGAKQNAGNASPAPAYQPSEQATILAEEEDLPF